MNVVLSFLSNGVTFLTLLSINSTYGQINNQTILWCIVGAQGSFAEKGNSEDHLKGQNGYQRDHQGT